VKEWLSIAEEAIENGTLHLLLTGGEPLLREDFIEIYNELNQMGFIIGLNTNASLIDEKYYRLFSKYPPTNTSVTLYGANEDTYQKITGNGENFAKTIRGLEYLKDIPTNLDIKVTFVKDNYLEIDKIRDVANRYTQSFAINYLVFKPVPGVFSQAELCRLSPEECLEVDINNRRYYNKLNNETKKTAATIKEPDKRDFGLSVYPEVLSCLAAKAAYWISWDGRMLPCATFDALYTEPLKEGFSEAWQRLPTLFTDIQHPMICTECEDFHNCPNCPAYFYAETGYYDKVPSYICDMVKIRRKIGDII